MARIALDIDSTLHHYWDLLDRARPGAASASRCRYDEQTSWGITVLEPDQLVACIHETHSEENVLAAEPYPDAVETVPPGTRKATGST